MGVLPSGLVAGFNLTALHHVSRTWSCRWTWSPWWAWRPRTSPPSWSSPRRRLSRALSWSHEARLPTSSRNHGHELWHFCTTVSLTSKRARALLSLVTSIDNTTDYSWWECSWPPSCPGPWLRCQCSHQSRSPRKEHIHSWRYLPFFQEQSAIPPFFYIEAQVLMFNYALTHIWLAYLF